jgi:hypothetical protein
MALNSSCVIVHHCHHTVLHACDHRPQHCHRHHHCQHCHYDYTIISIIVIIISRVVVFVVIIVVIVINIISGSSAVLSGPRLDKGWQGLQGSCCALLAWRAFTTCVHWD